MRAVFECNCRADVRDRLILRFATHTSVIWRLRLRQAIRSNVDSVAFQRSAPENGWLRSKRACSSIRPPLLPRLRGFPSSPHHTRIAEFGTSHLAGEHVFVSADSRKCANEDEGIEGGEREVHLSGLRKCSSWILQSAWDGHQPVDREARGILQRGPRPPQPARPDPAADPSQPVGFEEPFIPPDDPPKLSLKALAEWGMPLSTSMRTTSANASKNLASSISWRDCRHSSEWSSAEDGVSGDHGRW